MFDIDEKLPLTQTKRRRGKVEVHRTAEQIRFVFDVNWLPLMPPTGLAERIMLAFKVGYLNYRYLPEDSTDWQPEWRDASNGDLSMRDVEFVSRGMRTLRNMAFAALPGAPDYATYAIIEPHGPYTFNISAASPAAENAEMIACKLTQDFVSVYKPRRVDRVITNVVPVTMIPVYLA